MWDNPARLPPLKNHLQSFRVTVEVIAARGFIKCTLAMSTTGHQAPVVCPLILHPVEWKVAHQANNDWGPTLPTKMKEEMVVDALGIILTRMHTLLPPLLPPLPPPPSSLVATLPAVHAPTSLPRITWHPPNYKLPLPLLQLSR